MLKQNRKKLILEELNKKNFAKVVDLRDMLDVTEMTIRRDLQELEQEGSLIRVHGGAKRVESIAYTQLQHDERSKINVDMKKVIARKAAALVQDDDVIFISASTTNEFMHDFLDAKNVKVVTNCLYIYYQYMNDPEYDAILIGGKYDKLIQSFLGTITLETLSKINFTKAFVGTNAVSNNKLFATNDEEGLLHRTVLENSKEKYALCDSSKFNSEAFFNFYTCDKLTAIITNNSEIDNILEYRNIVSII